MPRISASTIVLGGTFWLLCAVSSEARSFGTRPWLGAAIGARGGATGVRARNSACSTNDAI